MLVALPAAMLAGSSRRAIANDAAARPNIIFVLADDLGWSELGCYGNGFNETPHLDRLASQGMRFTQAYAAAPVCSPYRAAFLTGQHPARIGIVDYLRPNSANALSTDHTTLAEMLQGAGYATGMIGKWHLTGYRHHDAEYEVRPTDHGFGWNFASEVKGVGNGANFWPYVFRKQPIRWIDIPANRLGEGEYLTDRLNVEAVDFIEKNKDRPFFLYLSHYAPHTILNGRPDLVAKYRRKHKPGASTRTRCYLCQDHGHEGDTLNHWAGDHNPHLAAMLESIDEGIGLITRKLDELDLTDNTILIFTSDNGGETNVTSNAPLRGGKSQLYEGGIRVPMMIRWPSNVPAAAVCNQPTMNVDFYPTLLEATGVEQSPKQTLDGVSTLAAWRKPSAPIGRETLYWHYPLDRPHFLGGVSSGAIRDGNWKLIEFFDNGKTELHSLTDDPSEQRDVASQHPELVGKLKKKLADWQTSIGARHPSPPLLTETRQLYFGDHFSSERASKRWWFNADWSVENGVLIRGEHGTATTRIFLREVEFRDVVIRFDFQMRKSKDIRLVTGGGGHYNAVIHIRPDHFYVQTAKDDSGPFFSYRHGECAYQFEPDRWYTMTVEFIGDQLVAHIDREHLAYARHPILDKERGYFAFQVDENPAAFDNVQILTARPHSRQMENLKHILAASGKHPVPKTLAEQFDIQKRNAHEWLYQRDAAYRDLVKQVDELDAKKKERFPDAFQTNKEFRKKILALRKKLNQKDARYKELLHATHRANRAIDAWLFAQQPGAADLPDSRRKRKLEQIRRQHKSDPEYLRLVAVSHDAQQRLEKAYPQLFISDKAIKQTRAKQRDAVKNDPDYKKLTDERAAAYRDQQASLLTKGPQLAELKQRLDQNDDE
jgi:arylsulfatase A-like enzyme